MVVDDLRRIPLFCDLKDAALRQLGGSFVELQWPSDHYVAREGTPANAFYVVKEGAVAVYRDTVGKPVQLLARLGQDEYFGEFGLFDEVAHSASIRTTQPSRILKIGKAAFLAFLAQHPGLALRLQMAAAKWHSLQVVASLELSQREDVRIRVDRVVVLTLDDGPPQHVTLENVSAGGLSLRGVAACWHQGQEVTFQLRAGRGAVDCHGRIAWLRGDCLGLAFLDPDGPVAELRELLKA